MSSSIFVVSYAAMISKEIGTEQPIARLVLFCPSAPRSAAPPGMHSGFFGYA